MRGRCGQLVVVILRVRERQSFGIYFCGAVMTGAVTAG
jgi:hypothetical protein